eukprot:CAMPEP_0197561396 /NCGR_PEP_ID=MMETSP1320-20131121/25082_1 /TAXON_ID=91990 /ORGANISM="Bolidomonas sp., Strain RCC2347" /LENGTH=89 /DNA_ID=CAMNT_0043123025 /DNA_START=10 /DNA_END=276 /DNA_ORIENTATION=+
MKMMNGSERHAEARERLWALMKLCISAFPPSPAVENWLEFFLVKNGRVECLRELHKTIFKSKMIRDLSPAELRSSSLSLGGAASVSISD